MVLRGYTKGIYLKRPFCCLLLLISMTSLGCLDNEGLQPEGGFNPSNPHKDITEDTDGPPPLSEAEKHQVLDLYYKIKFTHALTNLVGRENQSLSVIHPDVDPRWISIIKDRCKVEASDNEGFIDRLLYNRNLTVSKSKNNKHCPIYYDQEIQPEVTKFPLRWVHSVPTQVHLQIKNPDGLPAELLHKMSLTGEANKVTTVTGPNSGNSRIQERVIGLLSETANSSFTLDYESDISYWWDNGVATDVDATLSWKITFNKISYYVKELHSRSGDSRLKSKLFINDHLISTYELEDFKDQLIKSPIEDSSKIYEE